MSIHPSIKGLGRVPSGSSMGLRLTLRRAALIALGDTGEDNSGWRWWGHTKEATAVGLVKQHCLLLSFLPAGGKFPPLWHSPCQAALTTWVLDFPSGTLPTCTDVVPSVFQVLHVYYYLVIFTTTLYGR